MYFGIHLDFGNGVANQMFYYKYVLETHNYFFLWTHQLALYKLHCNDWCYSSL